MKIVTSHNVEINYSISSLQKRVKAYLIDLLIKVVYFLIIILFLIATDIEPSASLIISTFVLPIMLYSLLFEIFFNGQTPGKMWMNIQVSKLDGTQPSVGDYLLRWIACLLEFTLIQGLALIIYLSNYKGQRLGDILAGTTVINKEKEYSIEDTILHNNMDFEAAYNPFFPAVTKFSNKDIETIKKALNTYVETNDSRIISALSRRIKETLNMDESAEITGFVIETMIKDYNYYQQKESLI